MYCVQTEKFVHSNPCVAMIILWASFQANIFWLPNEFLFLLTPNMHAFFNISTYWGSFQDAKITLFFNPEEGDFLTTRVSCAFHLGNKLSARLRTVNFFCFLYYLATISVTWHLTRLFSPYVTDSNTWADPHLGLHNLWTTPYSESVEFGDSDPEISPEEAKDYNQMLIPFLLK